MLFLQYKALQIVYSIIVAYRVVVLDNVEAICKISRVGQLCENLTNWPINHYETIAIMDD